MKRALTAVLLGSVVLAAAGCGNARGNARAKVMPSGVGVRHSLRADVAAEIRAAQRSDARLFRIFPARRGSVPCRIPAGGVTSQRATCRTSVSYPTTHGRYAEAFVDFRERWGERHRSYSGWTVIVQWPAMKVAATQLHGATAPQMRYVASDSVWAIQGALDAKASYAEKVAGAAHVFAGVRIDDASNHVDLYLVHAPQSVLDTLNARHPGTYVIHNNAARTLHAVLVVQHALDLQALRSDGIAAVSSWPTLNGHLIVGVTHGIAKAQAYFDASYGRGFVRVVHGEQAQLVEATGPTG